MPIREDLVASAAQFLQDPSVAASPVENRIAFLQAKNLTQEEVNAALAQAASTSGSAPPQTYTQPPPHGSGPPQPYYGQPYPPQYPPYAWQAGPQEMPRRDWRDWFIMATVVSGVGYGLFSLGKRYVYPLIAPPTPERLEQDKKSIDEQFEKTFTLVEQLSKDTEALKAAEQQRTERLDTALSELETVITDLKSSNRRRDDEAQRVRDDVQSLKDAIPTAINKSKDVTENRLKELNNELKSLKTLITQRMNTPSAPTVQSSSATANKPRDNATTTPAPTTPAASAPATGDKAASATAPEKSEDQPKKPEVQDYVSGLNRSSPFNSGAPPTKASIPAWQLAMAKKKDNTVNAGATSSPTTTASGSAPESGASGAQDSA